MLDIGWSEMAIIAVVALVVIGPKDLPKAMRAVAFWVRKGRRLAAEFHSGIDQILREAELEEARDAIRSASQINLSREIENTIDPTGEVAKALTPPSEPFVSASPSPTLPSPSPPAAEQVTPATSEPAAPAPVTAAPEPAVAEPNKPESAGR